MFGSFERTLFEGGRKTLLVDLSQSLEAGGEGQGGGGNGWFIRRVCSQVEWTDVQAVVADEDAVIQLSGEFVGDERSFTTQLDSQIGNTKSSVDDIGFDDGTGGASLNTEGAASAQICGRLIFFQIQRRQNFPEQEP